MITRIFIAVLAIALLSACSSTGQNQNYGAVIGGVLGGLAGAKVSGKSDRVAGIAIGTAVGAVIGYGVGRYLDENDRKKMADATVQTAESGQPQVVRSPDSGATIRTTPVASVPSETAKTANNCRTVRQSVDLPDGRSESEDVTVCKGANGWEAV